ncbi:MAG: helix-turn-helix domain-containing protein [Lactobacillus iners]|nr:helix-turn-helix domain-containing protein [Lactobacillus iners]
MEERELAIYSGNVIRELRNSMGLTQKELGKKVGVSNSAIANYEKGFRAPLQDTLFKLAETFNVSVNKFFPYDFESRSSDSPLLSQITDTAAKLHEPRQKKVLSFTQDQLDEQEGRVEEVLSYYALICNGAVSAGTGEWLEDEVKEEITISADKVPS